MSSACLVARTSCARKIRAPSHAPTAVTASVPASRSSTGAPSVSPTKSLRDADSRTGQPVAVSSPSRLVSSRECQVFLPKSCAGSMTIRAGSTPPARPLGEPEHAVGHVRHDVGEDRPERPGARRQGTDVRADEARAELRGHVRDLRIPAAPGVVEQVGARLADRPGRLVPPGVHADHQVRVGGADRRDERDRAADLLGDRHLGTRLRRDAAHVENVRALGHRGVHPLEGGTFVPGRSPDGRTSRGSG